MSRPIRILYEDAYYHVMNRGLARDDIFLKDRHREIFLDLLGESCERFKIEVHSYCLMDNHYHLLIKTPLANLDKAMRHLNSVYSMRFNSDMKRDGPIFRGRYKAILVEASQYLLNVSKYIHRNPSSAGIVNFGKDDKYKWSSYRYYIKSKGSPKWLQKSEVMSSFDNKSLDYKKFVDDDMDLYLEEFYSKERLKPILGGEDFVKDVISKFFEELDPSKDVSDREEIINKKYSSLDEVVSCVCELMGLNRADLLEKNHKGNVGRKIGIYISSLNPKYTLREVGKYYGGLSSTAISKACKRFKEELMKDEVLNKQVDNCKEKLGIYE